MEDDDDFEDLFEEVDMNAESQESLNAAAANVMFDDVGLSNIPPFQAGTSQDDAKFQDANVDAGTVHNPIHESASRPVVGLIEDVFDKINKSLLDQDDKLTIQLRARPNASRYHRNDAGSPLSKPKELSFPGRTAAEAWRFTVVIRILDLVHEALSNGVVLSKRDMYYRDPALFGSQSVVDRYVDDIASTFNVPRSSLNVTAAAKGLVAGAFRFCRRDGSIVDARDDRDGMLVPPLRDILSVDLVAVKWILVVEKEATFRSIASSSLWDTISTSGIIVTGKGYPDLATRALLHCLCSASPQNGFLSPPVFGLADCDPDGLAILCTYRNGSAAMAHENHDLIVPQLQWLGLHIDQMMDESLSHNCQGLLSLTARDRRRAVKMLERNIGVESEQELHMSTALQTMLMLNKKAELQLLDGVPNGMTNLLAITLSNL